MAFRYKGLDLKHPYLMKMLKHVQLTFTRDGVAYDKNGNSVPSHTPIFEHKVPKLGGGFEIVNGIGIYEAHTNILPAETSQSLNGAYTTPALTGTYTFQVEGSGSVVLSGGATGTVSFGNHVTATLSGQTVTLTGTATMIQILNKAYPLPWGLGGVTVPAETLLVSSDVLNLSEGTIELEAYMSDAFKGKLSYLMSCENGSDYLRAYSSAGIYLRTGNISGSTSLVRPTPSGIAKIQFSFNNSYLDHFVNLDHVNSPNPYLHSSKGANVIFGRATGQEPSTIIKNVVFSNNKRTESKITERYYRDGFGVDKQVTLVVPLTHDLRAYRVARC